VPGRICSNTSKEATEDAEHDADCRVEVPARNGTWCINSNHYVQAPYEVSSEEVAVLILRCELDNKCGKSKSSLRPECLAILPAAREGYADICPSG
jgi:hypothetical protein